MRYKQLLLLGCLFSVLCANAQNNWTLSGKSLPQLRSEMQPAPLSLSLSKAAVAKSASITAYPTLRESFSTTPAPRAYCYSELGMFCKLEVQMEKVTKFPVKLRLGEAQQVERLEGKLSDGLKRE